MRLLFRNNNQLSLALFVILATVFLRDEQQQHHRQSISSSGSSIFCFAWTSVTLSPLQSRRIGTAVPQPISSTTSFRKKSVNHGRSNSRSSSSSVLYMVTLLQDWKLLTNGRISGKVQNHPEIPDGRVITTSPLLKPEQTSFRLNTVVTTSTGSKYQLGDPHLTDRPNSKNGKNEKVPLLQLQKEARINFDLTGEVVGDDDRQYLLSGPNVKSTSGKSRISKAYEANQDGLPTGDSLTVKLSTNTESMEREAANYYKITQSGLSRGKFVQLVDVLSPASIITKKFGSNMNALVLERGVLDLKRYINENGKLEGKELREAAVSAAQCLQAIHNSGLVWTDLKTENFVVTRNGQVKGIDLESCMPQKENPVDYSPEATPPEFAVSFLDGDGPYFELDYSYDVWSFGMLLYEISTGKGFFDGMSPMQTIKMLRGGPIIEVNAVPDRQLRNLVAKCLLVNAKQRPNIVQILLHPYFLKGGIGPVSF